MKENKDNDSDNRPVEPKRHIKRENPEGVPTEIEMFDAQQWVETDRKHGWATVRTGMVIPFYVPESTDTSPLSIKEQVQDAWEKLAQENKPLALFLRDTPYEAYAQNFGAPRVHTYVTVRNDQGGTHFAGYDNERYRRGTDPDTITILDVIEDEIQGSYTSYQPEGLKGVRHRLLVNIDQITLEAIDGHSGMFGTPSNELLQSQGF